MTFLAIDVGNTRLKWALYQTPHPDAPLVAQGAEFLENIEKLSDGAWATLAPPNQMLGCIVAGDAVKRRFLAGLHVVQIPVAIHGGVKRKPHCDRTGPRPWHNAERPH